MNQMGLTAIDGIQVGHYTDAVAKTGCTAVLFEHGAVAGVDVRGSAPGTRETDLLRGFNSVERINAILLCGGSAYGLDAASGAMQYLEERNIGVPIGNGVVPIVPAAVIFDLGVGNGKVRPGKREGYLACQDASSHALLCGPIGAGTGATVGKAFGPQYAMASGLGSCCMELSGGVKVAALAVVNAFGDVYDHHNGMVIAGASIDGQLRPCMEAMNILQPVFGNTTIGIVATNAMLTREQATKLASIAHDGLAMSIRPVHTVMDGDTFFGISTYEIEEYSFISVLAAASEVVACAIENAFCVDK